MDDLAKQIEELKRQQQGLGHVFASLQKAIDDLMWYQVMQDVAVVDKVVYCGPPPANTLAQSAQDKGNPLKIRLLVPKTDRARNTNSWCGGVHANFTTIAHHQRDGDPRVYRGLKRLPGAPDMASSSTSSQTTAALRSGRL